MTDVQEDLYVACGYPNGLNASNFYQASGLVGYPNSYFKPIYAQFSAGWDDVPCSEIACCISYLGGNLSKIYVSNYAEGLVRLYKDNRRFGNVPQLGAFIWFDYGTGVPSHTGRVVGIENNIVYTIEGNVGGYVRPLYYAIDDYRIYGYGYPNYNSQPIYEFTERNTSPVGLYKNEYMSVNGKSNIMKNGDLSNRTLNGITFTYNSSNDTWRITGTATAQSQKNIYYDLNALPSWFKKNRRITMENDGTNVVLDVYLYKNGSYYTGWSVEPSYSPRTVVIPNDAEGLVLRLRVRSGSTVNATVHAKVYYTPYNTNPLGNTHPLSADVMYASTGYSQGRLVEVYNEINSSSPITSSNHIYNMFNTLPELWLDVAQANQIPTGSTPSEGAIGVYKRTYNGVVTGFVLNVEKINGTTFDVSYSTDSGFVFGTLGEGFKPQFMQGDYTWELVGFIYALDKVPTPPEPPPEKKKTFKAFIMLRNPTLF